MFDAKGETVRCPELAIILMAYLHDVGHPVSRRDAASLLWPQVTPAARLTNLRSLVRRTVQAFDEKGPCPLIVGNSTLTLDRALMRVDFAVDDEGEPYVERLRRLIAAVSGGFLRGDIEPSSPLWLWSRAVERRLQGCLDSLVKQADDRQDRQTEALLREAAVYLAPGGAHVSEVRLPAAAVREAPKPFSISAPGAVEGLEPHMAVPRIALLPPVPAKGTSSILFRLASAMVEDVTIDLCQERSFVVVSPYTADKLRGEANKAEFLQRHHVNYALDTRLSGETLLVQLIFYPTDEIIWAARLPIDRDNLVIGRQKLITDLCTNVTGHILRSRARHDHYLTHADAYRHYLLGSQQMLHLSLPAIRKARKHFRAAISATDGFALALSSLSRTLYVEWLLTARGDPDLLAEADRLARQAIAVDPMQSAGYRELGMTQIYLGDLDHSIEALAHAEQLSPHHADGLYSFGDTLVHASRPQEALVKLNSAMDHSPIVPDSYLWSAAGANYFLGRYGESIALVNRMNDPSPADRIAAAAYAMNGDLRQARVRVRRVMEANPSFDVLRWLDMVPVKDQAHLDHYREGLLKAGF
ncbi:adenylate cyclase [Xaviernesmea oryzae]|uniref:adenylate cyclase n=1 Tax=Xaviernesmea oryzae TaxID=464029 RepID=UPI001115287A|nr:adenylate cyclase [Xaviernesmea oryzae]